MVTDPERPSIADTAQDHAPKPGQADYPRLDALARRASRRFDHRDDGDIVIDDRSPGFHQPSYQPLADKLHKSEPPPPILKPTDMVMKPVRRMTEKERVKAVVDKTIRSAMANGTIEQEAGEALLAGRYSQWLDKKFPTSDVAASETASDATAGQAQDSQGTSPRPTADTTPGIRP
ncbi:MAG: hypothetical protein AAF213_06185 [Pseudomonadota bacterium]